MLASSPLPRTRASPLPFSDRRLRFWFMDQTVQKSSRHWSIPVLTIPYFPGCCVCKLGIMVQPATGPVAEAFGGHQVALSYGDIELELIHPGGNLSWTAHVFFFAEESDEETVIAGRDGFLEYFTATFIGDEFALGWNRMHICPQTAVWLEWRERGSPATAMWTVGCNRIPADHSLPRQAFPEFTALAGTPACQVATLWNTAFIFAVGADLPTASLFGLRHAHEFAARPLLTPKLKNRSSRLFRTPAVRCRQYLNSCHRCRSPIWKRSTPNLNCT